MTPGQSDNEPRKVYFTSSGDYSDYNLGDVFETEADAEAHVADGGDERVEEAWMWPTGTRPQRVTFYRCGWTGPGNEPWARIEHSFIRPDTPKRAARAELTENEYQIAKWRNEGRPASVSPYGSWLYGTAPTEQDAHKALKDRIAAIRVREGL